MKYITLSCYVIAVLMAGCNSINSKSETEIKIEAYPVIQLMQKDTAVEKNYVAAIQAKQNVEIRSKLSGFLEKIYIDEGQEVQKGQALFKINDRQLQIEMEKAKASLQSASAEANAAELEAKRVQILVEKKIVSKTELDLANAKLRAAQAKVTEVKTLESDAELRLSYTLIRAPFNGIINRIPFKLGSLLSDGALLTTVSDLSAVYAYFNVSENEYLQYFKKKLLIVNRQQEERVKLILADDSYYPFDGKIEIMEGEFDKSTGSIAFRAIFPNPDKILKHGATGKISILTDLKNAILIPQKSVFDIQDKNYVFMVDSANKVHMKSFVPKGRVAQFYLVDNGLKPGDKIVYEGIQTLSDGDQIKPKFIQTNSLMP